jgi:ankyrin repeat protein/serine/threonine protein kinase
VNAYPGAVQMKEMYYNRTVLHLALEKRATHDIVILLLAAYPTAVKMKNINNCMPLHISISTNAPFETIKMLVDAYPKAAETKDKDSCTPLHSALAASSSRSTIETIFQAYPDAVKVKCSGGMLPLHLALEKKASSEILRLILNAYPGACRIVDWSNMTPLHWAIKKRTPLDIVKTIIEAFPSAIGMKDGDNKTPIHHAVEKNDSVDVFETLFNWYSLPLDEQRCDEDTPLHWILEKNASHDIVKILLRINATAFSLKDSKNRTPLYWALEKKSSAETIQLFVDAYPEALKLRDDPYKATPLHWSLAVGASPVVVKVVFDAYPAAASLKDNSGCTPFRVAIENRACSETVKMLFEAYPAAVEDVDSWNMTSLHRSIEKRASVETITMIFKAYPAASSISDNINKMTPLHWALFANAAPEIIEMLFYANPSAAEARDVHNMTPLHRALENNASPDIVKMLFVAYPEAVEARDDNNMTPLDVAAAKGTSLEALYGLVMADFPLNFDGSLKSVHFFTWTNVLDPSYKVSLSTLKPLVKRVFDNNKQWASRLVSVSDPHGREAISITHPKIGALMMSYLIFMDRYTFISVLHKSETSLVLLANDSKCDKGDDDTKVALKFMTNKSYFNRELVAREGLPSVLRTCVMPVIASCDGDSDNFFIEAVRRQCILSPVYRYMLVLPLAQKNLLDVIIHDNLCGNIEKVQPIILDICECLSSFHARNRVHGDLKPSNVVRNHDDRMLLIDLDASANVSKLFGVKCSTACAPPEMLYRDEADGILKFRRADVNPLVASLAYDMWTLGVLMYYLCSGQTLWQADFEDNIVDYRDMIDLAEWNQRAKNAKLTKIAHPLALNLISQLLVKDPFLRPDILVVLRHPFLTGKGTGFDEDQVSDVQDESSGTDIDRSLDEQEVLKQELMKTRNEKQKIARELEELTRGNEALSLNHESLIETHKNTLEEKESLSKLNLELLQKISCLEQAHDDIGQEMVAVKLMLQDKEMQIESLQDTLKNYDTNEEFEKFDSPPAIPTVAVPDFDDFDDEYCSEDSDLLDDFSSLASPPPPPPPVPPISLPIISGSDKHAADKESEE